MAAVSLKSAPEDVTQSSPAQSERRPRGGRRRWPWIVAAGAVLLYFAPALVALTGLRDVPLRMIFDGIEGTIHSEGASLGWFSTVEYRGVEVHDRAGELLVRVPTVTVDRTAMRLLGDRRQLGKIVLNQPQVHFVAREGGSNAEEVLLPWWNAPSSGPVELELEVVDGAVELHDEATKGKWTITDLAAGVHVAAADEAPTTWSAEGKVDDGSKKGQFAASSSGNVDEGIKVKAEQAPLGMFGWLAERSSPGLRLGGDLACDIVYRAADASGDAATTVAGNAPRQSIVGTIGVANLIVAGGALGNDALRLADLMITSDVTRHGERIEVKQLAIDCELGRIVAKGNVGVASAGNPDGLAALAREAFALEGSVDLARLARMLPQTLRIRSDTQIDAGAVRLLVASEPAERGHKWHARIEASGLAATSAGKPLRWEQPIAAELAARDTKAGIVVDRFECTSDFFQVYGQGTADLLAAEAKFDLDRLTKQFGQLIDFGELKLAGTGQAQLQWQRDREGAFLAMATVGVTNFQLATSPSAIWREANLAAEMQATVRMSGTTIERVESAALRLQAADAQGAIDRVEVHLREPIAGSAGDQPLALDKLPLLVKGSGSVAGWQARLAPWVDLSSLNLVGSGEVHANLTRSGGTWQVHSLRGDVQHRQAGLAKFALQGLYSPGDEAVRLDEVLLHVEAVKLTAKGQIDALGGKTNVNLRGQTEYDWAALSKLLSPYFGDNIRAEGRDTRAFAVRGPMAGAKNAGAAAAGGASAQASDPYAWLLPLEAEAGIGWQRAVVFGLPLGPGDIEGKLSHGVLRVKPVELAVSEGRVRLSPQVVLTPGPAELVHGQAKVMERVRVTPAMTASWLKYVAPAVADATETQGELSLHLAGAKLPLSNPAAGSAVGQLEMHSLQVTPGPTARATILLAEQIRALVERRPPPMELGRNPTLLRISEQKVDFRMAGGRVAHQGMTMDIGSVTVRTHGWVAFDETMGLVAEVPIKAEWFGGNAMPAGLKDQTLQIPIGGTLRRPQVDPRAMQQVVALFAQNAARDLIEGQINKPLERLLDR